MSIRGTIYNTVAAALDASTSIAYVSKEISEDPYSYKEDQYPAVRVFDGDERKERFCYMGSTDILDMRSELEIDFYGYARTFDKSISSLNTALDDLLSVIETAVVNDSTMISLVQDITVATDRTDKGYSEGLGWVSGTFIVTYLYNHTSP